MCLIYRQYNIPELTVRPSLGFDPFVDKEKYHKPSSDNFSLVADSLGYSIPLSAYPCRIAMTKINVNLSRNMAHKNVIIF